MKNDVKIVVVTSAISPYRIPLFNRLTEKYGKNCKVIFAKKRVHYRKWRLDGSIKPEFDFSVLKGPSLKLKEWEIYFVPTLPLELIKEKPTIVISGGFSFSTIFSWLYVKICNKKLAIWSAETPETAKYYSKTRYLLRRFLVKQADGFVVSGSSAKEYLLSLGAEEDKIFLAYYSIDPKLLGLDSKKIRRKKKAGEKKKRILYVGRLTKLKGVDLLIRAYTKVKRKYPNIELCLVGYGPDKDELKKLTHPTDDISFEGYKQYDLLLPYYLNSDLFVFPTLKDVWGLPVNEAMMCGLPVVCSKYAGCCQDLIKEGENGLVVDPRDLEELSDSISGLISENGKLSDYGERSLQIIKDFTTERTTQGFVETIEYVRKK